ncbi:CRISPR-associated endonuclease Cas1 [Marinitoga piezophila KA3]|uniref:CRISPR-associated endonuclease Cas1 n=1 Tax=Marinitoga piezophila (strain DSM 14283 / JCM 11233 / KA3) TaxID=443254 RepID=H2J402_MARPK|nr:type I-B CRISPR-associated endonuclease Cas1b [Marinitoga piezophila]AEX84730.1 CRISPR-associated endonuclease Cas1 [Marinitoga piezophila KA3]
MKETIYIFSSGELKRKDNSIVFITSDNKKRYIPIENLKEILIFGEVNITKKTLEFLSQKEIIVSFYNYYGYYMGSYYPREHYNSGYMILKQAEHYINEIKRSKLAKSFVIGATKNSLKILKYYNRREKNLEEYIKKIESLLMKLEKKSKIKEIMTIEAEIKKEYYKTFKIIIENEAFEFSKRSKRPPEDRINALISFSNSIIYNMILKEIYTTHLDPRIGYLHTTNFRRFTLNLDIAEIFKPVIGDRTIFNVINKKIINEKHFETGISGVFLNNKGKQKFLEKLEERLKQTIKHYKLNKRVSYRYLIKIELYKLEKHLIGEEEYKPFVMEW